MAKVIAITAALGRIVVDIREAARNAAADTPEVAAEAERFLPPALAEIGAAEALLKPAEEAEAAAAAMVASTEADCNLFMRSIRDDLLVIFRGDRNNAHLTEIFPAGLETYTNEATIHRPTLMTLLQGAIEASQAAVIGDDQRKAWIAGLETRRQALTEALARSADSKVAATMARAKYRRAVHRGQRQLRRFKQALENLGLSKTRIFAIIPDARRKTPKKPTSPATPDSSSDGGGSTPTPKAV